MLRVYFLQQRFNLSDPATEEALYDIASMRSFAKIDLGREGAPDETTVCKFRHLLERQKLGPEILREVNAHLKACGVKISSGTIVDATIVHAQARPRTAPASATLRCTRRRRGTNGFSG